MRRLAATLVLLCCTACAGSSTPPVDAGLRPVASDATEIRVQVYRGLARTELASIPPQLVLDVTAAIDPAKPPAQGADMALPARKMLERVELPPMRARPELRPFHRLGEPASAIACPGDSGAKVHASAALLALREELTRSRTLDGTRVMLVSDLGEECAPALCRTASELVAAGAWIDVVQLGDAKPPACLAELRPNRAQPGALGSLIASAPGFRVETPTAEGQTRVVARGTAQGPPVEVPPGYHTVIVEVDPEETVGPVRLGRGQRATIRLMDFPVSAPNAREWIVELENAAP